MPAHKFQKGVIDTLSLIGLGFLMASLLVGTVVVANPETRQFFGASARYSPDALIRQRERTGRCTGKCCLRPDLPECKADSTGNLKPSTENSTTSEGGISSITQTSKSKDESLLNSAGGSEVQIERPQENNSPSNDLGGNSDGSKISESEVSNQPKTTQEKPTPSSLVSKPKEETLESSQSQTKAKAPENLSSSQKELEETLLLESAKKLDSGGSGSLDEITGLSGTRPSSTTIEDKALVEDLTDRINENFSEILEKIERNPESIFNVIKNLINGNSNPDKTLKTESESNKAFIYYSQRDKKWDYLPTVGRATIEFAGCGIMTGAMVTNTDPETYYDSFREYFRKQGQERLISTDGTSFDDHRVVLEDLGYTLVPIQGSLPEIKDQIRNYTDSGVPVWINAKVYGIGHNTVAIGVNSEGEIIFNDPYWGQNTAISDDNIDQGENNPWRVFAIIPPGN